MSQQEDLVKELIRVYSYINQAARYAGRNPIFKNTNRLIRATHEMAIPKDEPSFENLVKNLFIMFYEGSGHGKRLPLDLDEERIIPRIKELRNHFEHDREHGSDTEVRKKFRKIGNIFEYLIDKRFPSSRKDWVAAGEALLKKLIVFSNELLENLQGKKKVKGMTIDAQKEIEVLFEQDITIFPDKKEKSRRLSTRGEFSGGGICALFLPTFYLSPPAEFGDTRSAVYLTSEAPQADFEGFKSFMREIEQRWHDENNREFSPSSKLMPWSISGPGHMIYGSGSENLIQALNDCYDRVRACVTMVLQGIYGEDSTKTFFIVIGSDLRGGRFTYNFLDFYLSTIPIEWRWIKAINNSLDKLSPLNDKASNYTLGRYSYQVWEGTEDIPIDKDVIGAIGRSGYKQSKRTWDTFEGLILSKAKLAGDYILDKTSSWESYYELECPKDSLDEFIVSVTNHPPDVGEIQTGRLVGINRPRMHVLGFPGKGWMIFAINIWGISNFRQEPEPYRKGDATT